MDQSNINGDSAFVAARDLILLRLYPRRYAKLSSSANQKNIQEAPFMTNQPNSKSTRSPKTSEDIHVPSIPKQTAGAVAGATIGSVAGPVGAAIGGVVGALAGKAAASKRPIPMAVRDATTSSKRARKRHPQKRSPRKPSKTASRSRTKTRKMKRSRRSAPKSRKSKGQRKTSTSARAQQKRRASRTKRH